MEEEPWDCIDFYFPSIKEVQVILKRNLIREVVIEFLQPEKIDRVKSIELP